MPARGRRANFIDDESLLGSSSSYSDAVGVERSHFSIDTGGSSSASFISRPVNTLKSWWADEVKRRWIIAAIIAFVVLLIVIIAIAASAGGSKHEEPPAATSSSSSSSSSTGGGGVTAASSGAVASSSSSAVVPPVPSSSSAIVPPLPSSSSSSSASAPPLPDSSSSSSSGPAYPYDPTPWLRPRLPAFIVPSYYAITEVIDLELETFNGSVSIIIELQQPTMHILVHAGSNLAIGNVALTSATAEPIAAVPWSYASRAYLVLNLTSPLAAQSGLNLTVSFSAKLRESPLSGLYLAYYVNSTGQRVNLATTQFESFGARLAFPCFDEPALKARFQLTILNAPRWPTVLSNMPGVTTTEPNGWLRTTFQPSVVMSSYLVAMVVSDYQSLPQPPVACNDAMIESHVWAPAHLLNATVVPNVIAATQISAYCSYFKIDYPLPKEDHIYIPQFAAGAMENWGLITYRDTALLWDPAVNNVAQLQRVAVVIAHELAHQWFGNLVTAAWWSQIWLNEGFATYVEYIGADISNPELLMADQFISVAQRQALNFDSTNATRPIVSESGYGSSAIIYAKGGSVLRMIHGILGEKIFITGLVNYLTDFAYKSAVTSDVFNSLTMAAHAAGLVDLNITEIMVEWTEQAGYPLVSCTTRPNGDVTSWSCSQRRFFTFSNAPAPVSDQSWSIWLTASTSAPSITPALPRLWPATDRSITFDVQGDGWVKLNANNTAFMRVMYDNATWTRLSSALNSPGFSGIHHDDRLGLINDAFTFLDQKLLTVPQVLDLALFLQHDVSFPVRQIAQPAFATIYNRIKYFDNSTAGLLFAQYWNQSLTAIGRTLNVSNVNPAADQILESLVGQQLVLWNTGGLGDRMLDEWNEVQTGNKSYASVSPNRIDLLLLAATTLQGDFGFTNVLDEIYVQKWNNAANDSDEDDDDLAPLGFPQIINALTATQDVDALSQLTSALTDRSQVLPQHLPLFLLGLARNAAGLSFFNAWILNNDNWAYLTQNIGPDDIAGLLLTAMSLQTDPLLIAELPLVFDTRQLTAFQRYAIAAGIANANSNVAWLQAELPALTAYLESGTWRTKAAE